MADTLPWVDENAARDAIAAVRKDSDPTDWYGRVLLYFFCKLAFVVLAAPMPRLFSAHLRIVQGVQAACERDLL